MKYKYTVNSIVKLMYVLILANSCQVKSTNQKNQTKDSVVNVIDYEVNPGKNEFLEIAYVGNMGVLFENKEKTILIDGLHEKYKPAYLYPTKEMVEKLIDGEYKGFSLIDINLITHNHRDHFSAGLTKKFLKKNSESIVIGSEQIKEALIEESIDKEFSISDKVVVIDYDYRIQESEHNGIKVKSIRCDHSNQARHKDIKNIAYLIYLNNYSILHIGDTYWNFGKEVFEILDLKNENIDVAVIPYWMLVGSDSKEQILSLINPKKIIAAHIPPNYDIEKQNWLLHEYTNITVFTELNQFVEYKKTSVNK